MKRVFGWLAYGSFWALLTLGIFAAGGATKQAQEKQDPVAHGQIKGVEKFPELPEPIKKPSDQWLKDYEDFLALQRVIVNLKAKYGIDKLESELSAQGQALGSQIPAGYQFDQAKREFVATPKPQAVPASKK